MKYTFFNRVLGMILFILFASSCTSDLDFNQVDELNVKPVVVTNLAYFDLQANEFVDNGVEQPIKVDTPTVDVFNKDFFKDNLSRVDLFFEVNNTINRAYTLNLELLDANNQPLYNIPIDIPAYAGVENIVTKTEIFDNAKLDLLRNTTKISFVLTMLSGPPLSETSLGNLKLRSSVTAYLDVK